MLKQQAYDLIKQRLFELDLVSGQFVTQKQISEMIGVPLGPVREAMHQLQSEGLVQVLPQRGIQITPVTESMVRDLFGMRRLLEPMGMKELAKKGDSAALAELRRATKEILRKEKLGEIDRLSGQTFAIDQKLHEMTIFALRNQLIFDFYRVQQDRLRLIRLNIRASSDHEPGLSDHVSILDALCRRDGAAAVSSLLSHLKGVEQRALDAVARSPQTARTPHPPRNTNGLAAVGSL